MLNNLLLPYFLFAQMPQIQSLENNYSSLLSVSQTSDIYYQDWNFQALETLVKHHQIDGIFLDSHYLSRSQFIVYLKIVLDTLNYQELSSEDLDLLKQLKGNFIYELVNLEKCQSYLLPCTTSLSQQTVSFKARKSPEISLEFNHNLGDNNPDNLSFQPDAKIKVRANLINSDRLKLNFSTEQINSLFQVENFLHQDILRTNYPPEIDINIEDFSYRLPLTDQLNFTLSLVGNEIDDSNILSNQPDIDFISRFGRKNPLYRLIEEGGITLNYQMNDTLSFRIGYYGGELEEQQPFNQFLSKDSSLVAQVRFNPNDRINLGFLYIYSANDSNLRTRTGSERSQLNLQRPITANSYGFEAGFQVTPQLSLGGWVGLTEATVSNLGQANIWNYALTVGISDINKKGDFLGIIIGQEPKLTGTSGFTINGKRSDPDTSLLWEILYYYPVTENFSITPSFMGITAPDHDAKNPDNFIFTIRINGQF